MIEIKIHSMVDIITNSSTVIYTYHDGCVQPIKEMINEFLKTFNIEKTADEMFWFGTMMDELWEYKEYYDDINDSDIPMDDIIKLIEGVIKGEISKPDWMASAESRIEDGYCGSSIYVVAKEPEYEAIAKNIEKIITSVDTEEGHC